MTQAATFGRRTPLAPASPAPRSARTMRTPAAQPAMEAWTQAETPAYDRSITAGAFRSEDEELSGWKSERRAALFRAAGPWRWVALASASGTLALVITRHDPGHIAPVLTALTTLSIGLSGRRVRRFLRFRAEHPG